LNKVATRQFGVARLQQQQAVASRILTPSTRSLTSSTTSRQILSSRIRPVARQFQRQYSDLPPPPPKKKSWGWVGTSVKWTWRLTYLSVLGGLAYIAYDVYDDRHPADQVAPDPSKKTLVVLGKLALPPILSTSLVVSL
jgi:NADH:ubiquinone reductase (non-electrogenic)